MGYTHYWEHPDIQPGAWAELCSDARRIIKAAGVPVAGGDGKGKPRINGDEIRLNGVYPNDYETFWVSPTGTDFNFTKTGCEPYDLVVSTILLRATLTVPGFKVRSDGTWDEWQDARDLYAKVFGESAPDESPFARR